MVYSNSEQVSDAIASGSIHTWARKLPKCSSLSLTPYCIEFSNTMFFLLDPAIWRYQLYINLVSQDLEWTWIIWSFSTKVGIELIEFSWNYHGKFIPDITRPWHHGMLENPPCIEHWTFRIYCITVCPKMSWLSCPSWLCRTTRDSKNCNIPFSQVVENQQGNTRVDSGCSSTQCVHHPETMDILCLAAAYKKQCERRGPPDPKAIEN